MSEHKEKSNAPWILGIIGLPLIIMHYACAIVCSAGLAAGSGAETADASMGVATTAAGVMVACFILSFLGKSKISGFTGILLVLGGLTALFMSIPHFSGAGVAAGVCFLCAGISSICNRKKV